MTLKLRTASLIIQKQNNTNLLTTENFAVHLFFARKHNYRLLKKTWGKVQPRNLNRRKRTWSIRKMRYSPQPLSFRLPFRKAFSWSRSEILRNLEGSEKIYDQAADPEMNRRRKGSLIFLPTSPGHNIFL